MPEGNADKFKIPTTDQDMTSQEELWENYFGDEEEWKYFIGDIRARHAATLVQEGEDFIWIQLKLSGTECPFWDKQAATCRKPLDPRATCYNTRYLGGYNAPLAMKIGMPNSQRNTVSENQGLVKLEPMRPWTIWTPRLKDRDIVIRKQTGERFELLSVQESGRFRGLIMTQFFDMRPLQAGVDYGMNVTVDIDLGN